MENIKYLFNCKHCSQPFQGAPIIMGCCGESICSIHLDEEVNANNKRKLFTCSLCNESHTIKSSKKFATNKIAENLMKMQVANLNLGDTYEQAERECKRLEATLDNLTNLKNDPVNFIFEYISKLKNKVDLRREEIKLDVDRQSDDMIRRLEAFEQECYEKTKQSKLVAQGDELLKKARASLDEWSGGAKLMVSDESWRKEVVLQAKELDLKLINFRQMLKSNLLMNKVWMVCKNETFDKLSSELILFKE